MSSSSFYSDSGITTADADAVESSKNAAAQSAQDAAGHASTASEKATEANDSAVAAAASASTANNSNVQAVASNLSGSDTIGTVAGNIADINTVASMESDVDTLANATYKAKVETVADAAYKSDVETVAASGYKSDVETVADATYKAKVETVANGTYKSKVEEVAADLSGSNTIGAAVQSASDAATSASNAAASEASSYTNLQSVIAQAYNISTYAATASGHADDAEDAKTDAQAARDAAQGHRTQTGLDATAAAASATSASNSASAAASSEANAALSEQDAQGYSNAAAGSASTANTNALVAISEATDAADSASTASTASASAVAANTAAQAAKDDAEDAKDAAELAKTAAETAQTNASNYASTASTSASTATTKASEASSSAAAANTSATNAGVSYTNAFNAATDSVNAASTWSSFYTTYLGSYSSPPTTDVQGNPIVTGAFYYDTGAGSNTAGLYVYNGSSWVYSTNYNNVTAPYSLAQDLATNGNDISFGDNAKATFGASDDLEIYHQTSNNNSIIRETGGGDLSIQTNGSRISFYDTTNSANLAEFVTGGGCSLRHSGDVRFLTTSTGIDVTGTVTADGLTVSNVTNSVLKLESTGDGLGSGAVIGDIQFYGNDATVPAAGIKAGIKVETVAALGDDAQMKFTTSDGATNNIDRMLIANNGDISFYENTGTTPKFFWDASAERLGIGTTSPSSPLTVATSTSGWTTHLYNNAPSGSKSGLLLDAGSTVSDYAMYVRNAATNADFFTIRGDGNVGIGTTSPAEKLSIQDGDIIVQNDTKATFGFKGTSASTALAFRDRFAGVDRLTIDSSGNVGIGTSSPSATLDVAGIAKISGTEDEQLVLNSTDDGPVYMAFERSNDRHAYLGFGGSSDHFNIINEESSGALTLGTNGSERMRIDSSGKVGIGTTSPYVKTEIVGGDFAIGGGAGSGQLGLEVRGTPLQAIPSAQVRGYVATGDSGIGVAGDLLIAPRTSAAASVRFITGTSPAERLRIDASGNVGIGTSSPDYPLEVSKAGTSGTGTIGLVPDSDNGHYIRYGGSGTNNNVFRLLGTGNTERMRIDASGNVLVGKTSTSSAFTTVGIDLRPEGRSFMTRSGGPALYLSRTTSDGNIAEFYKDGSIVGSISVTGSATAYNTSSDERLKENITDSADAGSKIDAIQIRQFDWKSDSSHQDYGVIAQELVEVAPEAVHQPEDSEDMMGVDYSKLVPMLIKEVQTLRNRVAQLENN